MASIWMDKGAVVIPFINLEAVHAAYKRGREKSTLLGINLKEQDEYWRVLVAEEPAGRTFTIIESDDSRELVVRVAFLIVPVHGAITDRYYDLHRMAKIRFLPPAAAFQHLQRGCALQTLERPMALPDWPLYRPGSFNK